MIFVYALKTQYEKSFEIKLKVILLLSNIGFIRCTEKSICWESNFVPYKIDTGFSLYQRNYIEQEVRLIKESTCLYWSELPNLDDSNSFVRFEKAGANKTSCNTITTYPDGQNPLKVVIVLSDNCFYGRTVLHEIVHALGFKHEHQRMDRDCYVWLSNSARRSSKYKKLQSIPNLDRFPYDKQSIMHYPRSSDMRALSERYYENEPLGNQEDRLTDMDVWKIQYRFCGRLHYCDVYHKHCREMEELESKKNCTDDTTMDDDFYD